MKLLKMADISKRFPGVVALDHVNLEVDRGSVVGLVGENGAGKSTLMKILAGIHRPDSGTIELDGAKTAFRSPGEAVRSGIAIIHQELEVIDTLDIAGNVFLGREPVWGGPLALIDRKTINAMTERALARLGLERSPRTLVMELSTAERQLVEIAKALSLDARILVMDEPTSSLTLKETDRLFEVVGELRSAGVSVIYISHRLHEIERVADRVEVLRDGRNVGSLERGEINHDRMVRLMVGRDLAQPELRSRSDAGACLEILGLRTRRYPSSAVSLSLRRGEVLGLAGLVGAGRTELASAIFGVEPPLAGEIRLDGAPLHIRRPEDAIAQRIYLVPEDRRGVGLITAMNVRENFSLPALERFAQGGFVRKSAERLAAEEACTRFGIRTPSVETTAATLSGGNQQKVALAKWLSLGPKVILFDEPTRGVDVGAKAEIYQLMRRLADEGVAILMISSDMEEILGQSDRVAVMHEGRVTGVLDRAECGEEAIMRLAVA
jgi:ribose transport system ATP-binding protein